MMPSIILGLSALLLGAAGQSQYRPGGVSEHDGGSFSGGAVDSDDREYLDYQEQAQYRPGGPSDYEYDYENSITGGKPGGSVGSQTQQLDGSQTNGDQSQYGNQSGDVSYGIAGSTGNVGAGINGDLDQPSGDQSNRPNSNKEGAGQSVFGSTDSGGLSGNVGSDLQGNSESGQNKPESSGGKPINSETNENNQNKDDKNVWSLAEAIPGVAGDDYPIFTNVPETSFECDGLVNGGYYADPEAECQSFHVCASDGNGGLTKYSFMCPNGTIFNQQVLVCDWWFNVDCSLTEDLYSINIANAAERDANIGAGSEEKDTKNSENKDGKNAASKASSRQQGNEQSQNQSFLSADTSKRTSILLESDPKNSSRRSNGKDARNFGSESRPTKNQTPFNSRGKNFGGGEKSNEQKNGYIAPGSSESGGINQSQGSNPNGGKQNDKFQLIQNGQDTGIENYEEGFSGSSSIQPLNTGYGAPGGQVLGSYNQY